MNVKKQVFLVLGLSRSGEAAAEFLLSRGAKVYVYDDMDSGKIRETRDALVQKGAIALEKEGLNETVGACDGLVLSPGIPIDHPLAVAFKRAKKAVLGETELAARFFRGIAVGVTGTNGKTTTVSMIEKILQDAGLAAQACGNIGTPMLGVVDGNEEKVAVAEISSFQLETLQSVRPHIAMILNVTEDHLNRHYNMENYIFLKGKLLKNCTETEYAVLNYDDPIVRGFAEKTKAQVLYFSVKERVSGGYYENGDLYFGKEKILSVSDLPVGGLHNVQNALAVIVAAKIMGIKSADIAAALTDFKGIKHRVEAVGVVDGIAYINDSKGTNVDATMKAIEAMKAETVLLLGGKHKGYDYGKLFAGLSKTKVVHAVLYGENRFSLLKAAREYDYNAVTVCDKFDFAVRVASLKAKSGQNVLLSPASASFDEFANYEERGDAFVAIVQSFIEKPKAPPADEREDGFAEDNPEDDPECNTEDTE